MRVRLSLQDNKGSFFISPEEVIKVLDKDGYFCYVGCKDGTGQVVIGSADEIDGILRDEELRQEVIRMSKEEHTIPIPSTPPKFIDRGS